MNLEELLRPISLYHGSPTQGLRVIKPMSKSTDANIGKAVYATSNFGAACLYALEWTDEDAEMVESNGLITFRIKTNVIEKPISIYLIQKKNFQQIQDSIEFYSYERQGVMYEKRIQDPMTQAEKHGIKITRRK